MVVFLYVFLSSFCTFILRHPSKLEFLMGADFRRFRKRECKTSVHELSKRTGICATQIYKFERGQSDIKLKTLALLVHALGYDFLFKLKE